MPLRDHFRPPVDRRHAWSSVQAIWPTAMIQRLNTSLPENYIAEARTFLGRHAEVDIGTFEEDAGNFAESAEGGGTAVLTTTTAAPTFSVETDLAGLPEFEVLVYDLDRARQLVAAVEIVSPANKDRPEHRRAFAAKWAGLLQQQVCVIVVDPVTIKQFSLYAELLDLTGHHDPAINGDPPATYAVSTRIFQTTRQPVWRVWHYATGVGDSLPTLPLWLTDELNIPLELEANYEEACRTMRIT